MVIRDKFAHCFLKKSYIIISFFIIVSLTGAYSQNRILENFKIAVENVSADEKAARYLDFALWYKMSNIDSSLYYANICYNLAKEKKQTKIEIEALNLIALGINSKGNNDSTLKSYNLAKETALKSKDYYSLVYTYLNQSFYYSSNFNYFSELEILDSALMLVNKYNNDELEARTFFRIGSLYFKINEIQLSKYYADLASKALERIHDVKVQTDILFLKGKISFADNEISKSLHYFSDALTISKEDKNAALIQLSYRKIAGYYIDVRDFTKAQIYIDSSLMLCRENGYLIEESALITYKAHIAWLNGDIEKTLKYNKKALDIRVITGHITAECSSLLNIGGNYTLLGKYDTAYIFLNQGLQIALKQRNQSFIANAYKKLSDLNERSGNFENALKFTRLYNIYNDSVFLTKTNEKIILFSNLYETERDKRFMESIELEKKTNDIVYLSILIVLAIGLILLLFRINYLRRVSVKEIVKLSKVIETAKQAVVITDISGTVLYANNGLVDMLGYNDVEEVKEKTIYDFTAKTGKSKVINSIFPSVKKNGRWFGELILSKKNGTLFFAEISASILKEKGENDMFVALFNDISVRKKHEKEIKDSRESLRKTVDTQDRMFSIIAHDLLTPFNSILGFSKILSNDFDKYSVEEQKKFALIIDTSAKNIYYLLTNLLHWTRSQMGRIVINKERLNLNLFVKEDIELFQQNFNLKNIEIVNDIKEGFIVNTDMSTLSIVIRNLISNAIKFTNKGGKITLTAYKEDGNSVVNVEDNGVGMDKKKVESLFKNTYNESSPGTNNEKGTGLGLVLCHELITLNGGQLKVKSEPGKGSTFTIVLCDE